MILLQKSLTVFLSTQKTGTSCDISSTYTGSVCIL